MNIHVPKIRERYSPNNDHEHDTGLWGTPGALTRTRVEREKEERENKRVRK